MTQNIKPPIEEYLKGFINDPMWADHAEVPKAGLSAVLRYIQALKRDKDYWQDRYEDVSNTCGLVE